MPGQRRCGAGLADTDKIFYVRPGRAGLPIVYLGSKTGRDGIHGATMASAEFDEDAEEKRPTVQVGDPFSEKLLLEACLELMATGAVIAIQDMGAAGLTCSAVEMGAKGDLGVELDLDKVPCREEGMSAYEMMLSESQERMLMVLEPGKEEVRQGDLRQMGPRLRDHRQDDRRPALPRQPPRRSDADLPIKELGDEAPEYDRPWIGAAKRCCWRRSDVAAPNDVGEALVRMIALPDMCSRRWVWEQYDHPIQGNTGSSRPRRRRRASIRVERQQKGLAFTLDVTPRYCAADPAEGGKQAVAECWRNLTAVGAEPLAVTDNLNFGNPEKPDIMGQFVGCIQGIGEACRALDFPVVSGNVSLYNETNGKGILPTPAIGGVGLLPDVTQRATIPFKDEGEAIVLVGETKGHLGQSIYLRDIAGRKDDRSAPPPVDLAVERRNGDFIRTEIRAGGLSAVHDVSDGGILAALAEMAIASGIGAAVTPEAGLPLHAWAFGEDQARYLVTMPAKGAESFIARAAKAGVPALRIGTTGGSELTLAGATPISLVELGVAHEGWLLPIWPKVPSCDGRHRIGRRADMAMTASDIERLIKEALPDAIVDIRDLAGDGDHYAANVVSAAFRARPACSSTRWSIAR